MSYDGVDMDRLYDTVIELVDLSSGRLIASQRFAPRFAYFAAPGVVVSAKTNRMGVVTYHLLRLELTNNR